MKLEDFKVYQLAMELGEEVWNITIKWDKFAKETWENSQLEPQIQLLLI